MQENIMNAFAEQTKALYGPMVKLNQLLVDSMEKMTEFQLESVKSYSQIGLGQMRQAADIKDFETFRDYSQSHMEAANHINQKIMEDAKVLSQMSAEFKQEVEKIFQQMNERKTPASAQSKAPTRSEKRSNSKTS